MPAPRPLSDRTVLEIARAGGCEVGARAIALAGRIAADFGATVIKIEPPAGDPLRRAGPFIAGADERSESATFAFLNAGKRSLQIVDAGRSRQILEGLAGRAQAVLTDDADLLAAA